MKNIKGITLVALVVTIIILLILAGATIFVLIGENGLINKIIVAKKEQLESEVEEKLKLKIMKLQTDIVDKDGRQAVLEDLNNWTNSESDYYDSEIVSVTDSKENTNKLVEIDGYIFEVDENLNIIRVIDYNKISTTETTYQVNSIDRDIMQVTIKIKNALGIEKVIDPLGKEIIPQIGKTQIAIDYEVISGNNYIFKVKVTGSEEIKEYVLKSDINAKPEIDQNESYAYPILTEYGVEINKTVEIDYGENTNNYYSLDDGNTWNKYTETIKIQKECTLMAKTIIEGEITRENKKEINIQLANDAVPKTWVDGDENTSEGLARFTRGKFILVDESAIGKKIKIKTNSNPIWMYLINESGEETLIQNINGEIIPEGTKKIEMYNPQSIGVIIYEIGINTDSKIKSEEVYPMLTDTGIYMAYYNIDIEYYSTAIKKLYKINENGEWKDYTGKIRLEIGDTILVKGIDKNGNENSKGSYEANIENSVSKAWVDGDESTSEGLARFTRGKFILVDESAIGKKIKIKTNSNPIWMYLINESGEETLIKNINGEIIPEGTKKIEIYNPQSIGVTIYEIGIEK